MNHHPNGLDFETVSGVPFAGNSGTKEVRDRWSRYMHPHRGGHVRLVQIAHHDHTEVIDLYAEGIELSDLKDYLETFQPYVCHNASFEQQFLRAAGIYVLTYDTMILDAQLRCAVTSYDDEQGIRMYRSLNDVALDHIGRQKVGDEQQSDWSLPELTSTQLDYAMADAELVRDMFPAMMAKLPARYHPGVQMMAEATGPTAEVNLHGLGIDLGAHGQLIDELKAEASQMRQELIDAAGGDINPGSAKQVSAMVEGLLKEVLGEFWRVYVQWLQTQTGQLNLNKGYVTHQLPAIHTHLPELADWLAYRIHWRGKQKLVEAFGNSIHDLTDDDGQLRGEYRQHGAVTGRYSCARPNLQQIPSKTDERFRTLFRAPEGRKYVIADYSQIELRIAGLISDDDSFDALFRSGKDIHSSTAALMFGVDEPSDLQRKASKAVNFGVLFGATAPTISLTSGFPMAEAEAFLTAWLDAYPQYAQWTHVFRDAARSTGEFETAGHRRILCAPDGAATKLKNYPIQSSACDVLMLALIDIDEALRMCDLDAKVVALIHDEFIIEASPEDAEAAGQLLLTSMVSGLRQCYPDAYTDDLSKVEVVDSWAEKP